MKTESEFVVGVDFGGTKLLGALVDPSGQLFAEHRVATPYDSTELLDAVAHMVETLETKAGVVAKGVGVGAAGLVDRNGVLRFGPNVGHATNLDVLTGMAERLPNHEIRVDNDATCATWAECLLGAGKQMREMLLVTFGTGIGGGVVSGGRLVRGAFGYAGEPGHMTIEAKGVQCICNRIGCWEAYVSGRALRRRGREMVAAGKASRILELAGAVDDVRGEHVTAAAREGDVAGLELMDEFAWWMALGISNLIAIMDPQCVVIGGGLAEEADLYIEQTRRYVDELVFGGHVREQTPIVVATLGERAGAIGAAMLFHADAVGG